MQCLSPVESEVLNVVRAAGIEPDRIDDTQLLQAINTLISGGGSGSGGNTVIAGSEIGSVSAFAMPTPPKGWLVCDGSEVSRTDYADLYAAIGTVWGDGDQISTFNLPDLRGEFLRGLDAGRGVDVDRVFASSQQDQMQRITGKSGSFSDTMVADTAQGALGLEVAGSASEGGANARSAFNVTLDSANSPGARTGDETRPRNVAMTFAIKAFYPSAATGQ